MNIILTKDVDKQSTRNRHLKEQNILDMEKELVKMDGS